MKQGESQDYDEMVEAFNLPYDEVEKMIEITCKEKLDKLGNVIGHYWDKVEE